MTNQVANGYAGFQYERVPHVAQNVQYGPDPLADRLTPDEHTSLVRHLMRMLHRGEHERQKRRAHMIAVETDLLGIVEPTGTDCERKEKREDGEDVSVPDAIYPFGYFQLQSFASEIAAVVMPMERPYSVATSAETQDLANQLAKAFRAQGVMFDHRNNVHAAIFDMISLDLGGLSFSWDTLSAGGPVQGPQGQPIKGPNDKSGLKARQIDPYNVTWDTSVDLPDLATDGEFVAEYDIISPFEVQRRHNRKHFLNGKYVDDLRKSAEPEDVYSERFHGFTGIGGKLDRMDNWFYFQPEIARTRQEVIDRWGTNRAGTQTSFSGLFSTGFTDARHNADVAHSVHITRMFVRLQPSRWGLGPRLGKRAAAAQPYELWEIHLYGPGYIGYAAAVDFQMDRFPIQLSTMNFRRKFGRSWKPGESAAQLGLFASTIMNMHKRSMRKGLEGGLTIFNPDVVNLNDIPETSGGRVPGNMNRHDDDIRRHVLQLNDLPDTKNSMQHAQAVQQLMREMFPSNAQPMMAGLDRATTYQAQSITATGQISLLLYAGLVDGGLMVPMRLFMHRMNLVKANDLTYMDERKQQLITIAAEDMAKAEFELVQSQPLIGVDQMRNENVMRDVLNILFQSGGQLPPVAAMLLKHYLETSSLNVDLDEYMEAAQQQQEATMRQQQAETAGAEAQAAAAGAPQPSQ